MAKVMFVGLCINAIMFIFMVNLPVVIFLIVIFGQGQFGYAISAQKYCVVMICLNLSVVVV